VQGCDDMSFGVLGWIWRDVVEHPIAALLAVQLLLLFCPVSLHYASEHLHFAAGCGQLLQVACKEGCTDKVQSTLCHNVLSAAHEPSCHVRWPSV
jgi:hypothetical protein